MHMLFIPIPLLTARHILYQLEWAQVSQIVWLNITYFYSMYKVYSQITANTRESISTVAGLTRIDGPPGAADDPWDFIPFWSMSHGSYGPGGQLV